MPRRRCADLPRPLLVEPPSTRHSRNSCRAARRVVALVVGFSSFMTRQPQPDGRRRQLPRRLFGQAPLIVGVSTLPVTAAVVWTTSRPTSRLSSASMLCALALGGLVRPDEDLFGRGHRLLRFLGLDAGGRGAGLLDQLLAFGVGLRQDVLPLAPRSRPARP